MKKLFILLLLIFSLGVTAQGGTVPSYPTIKLTKTTTGTTTDDVVLRNNASGGVLKIMPVSEIKGTTNLNKLATPTGVIIYSDTGADAVLPLVTTTNAGLQSPADKSKLDGLESSLDTKVDKVTGKSLLSDAEIARLATLANYTHPANHPPSIISQDPSNRFVTDAEKAAWNAKQSALGFAAENAANKNIVNGYAGLGSDGKLISSQLPSITISDTFVTASQAAMLAVTAETGDVAVRTDLNKSFILKGVNPSVLADWQELLTPTSTVTTVFGRNGAVVAQTNDYTADQITETATRKFQTATQNTNNNATSPIQGQINLKEPAFTKNTAFNKNFGTAAGTVAEGNYSPAKDGTGATGNWGINISGNASSATRWGGQTADFSNQWGGDLTGTSVPMYNQSTSNFRYGTSNDMRYFLGLGSNAYTSIAYLPITGGTLIGSLHGTNISSNGYFSLVTNNDNDSDGNSWYGLGRKTDSYVNLNGWAGIRLKTYAGSFLINQDGTASFPNTITASGGFFNSDLRLKNIIKRDGDIIYFKWKNMQDDNLHIGYVAQEVQKNHPDQVQEGSDENKTLSVNYVEILVEKIRILEKRLDSQSKKIKQLQKRK
jgi:hypothetical protein